MIVMQAFALNMFSTVTAELFPKDFLLAVELVLEM